MIPYMAMIKVLTNLISHSTERRRKRGVYFNHTMSDFALEDCLSIYIQQRSILTLSWYTRLKASFDVTCVIQKNVI